MNKLKKLGFDKVWAYEAGMAEWFQKGLSTQGKCSASYLNRENKSFGSHDSKELKVITTEELSKKIKEHGE